MVLWHSHQDGLSLTLVEGTIILALGRNPEVEVFVFVVDKVDLNDLRK
jgi:hypothetical protein